MILYLVTNGKGTCESLCDLIIGTAPAFLWKNCGKSRKISIMAGVESAVTPNRSEATALPTEIQRAKGGACTSHGPFILPCAAIREPCNCDWAYPNGFTVSTEDPDVVTLKPSATNGNILRERNGVGWTDVWALIPE